MDTIAKIQDAESLPSWRCAENRASKNKIAHLLMQLSIKASHHMLDFKD